MEREAVRTSLKLVAVASALVVPLTSQAAAATVVKPPVLSVTQTSEWDYPSPDPTGLTYRSSTNTILVVDSEVEETPLWDGVNLWETTPAGVVVGDGSTAAFSDEPTDIASSPGKRLFVSDDDEDKVFIVRLGDDLQMGTADDHVRSFSTRTFGSNDAEGIAFDAGTIYIADGDSQTIFKVTRGSNKRFDGARPEGDDVVRQFSTTHLGLSDPEDVECDHVNRHLFIVSRFDEIVGETNQAGLLRRVFDLSDSDVNQPAGVALAPSTSGSGDAIFVADRGYDNDVHPTENDGRLFEYERSA